MTRTVHTRRLAVLALGLALVAGCQSSPPTRFYTLNSVAVPPADESRAKKALPVVVGTIGLPKYLDRPQVVTRPGEYVVELAEFDRWAEPLDDMVPRVIADNLSILLASDQVFIAGRNRVPARALQVEIAFQRFDAADDSTARLIARWDILDRDKDRLVAAQKSAITIPVSGAGYEAQTAALSEALARLCLEIADPLRRTGP